MNLVYYVMSHWSDRMFCDKPHMIEVTGLVGGNVQGCG